MNSNSETSDEVRAREPDSTPESEGEGGESGLGDRTDRQIEERAIRDRWPISDDQRVAIVTRLMEIVESDKSKRRERVSAARTLIQADRLNVGEKVEIKQEQVIRVEYDDNWYGNRDAYQAAEGEGTSGSGADGPGPV